MTTNHNKPTRKDILLLLKLAVQGFIIFIGFIAPYLKNTYRYALLSEEERVKVSKQDKAEVETTLYLTCLSIVILSALVITLINLVTQ